MMLIAYTRLQARTQGGFEGVRTNPRYWSVCRPIPVTVARMVLHAQVRVDIHIPRSEVLLVQGPYAHLCDGRACFSSSQYTYFGHRGYPTSVLRARALQTSAVFLPRYGVTNTTTESNNFNPYTPYFSF